MASYSAPSLIKGQDTMKFEATADRFAQCVNIAAESAVRDSAFAGIRIEASAKTGSVTLRTAGTSGAAVLSCPANVDESGDVSLPARLFGQIVSVAAKAGGEVRIHADRKKSARDCEIRDDAEGFWRLMRISNDAVLIPAVDDDGDTKPVTTAISHGLLRELREVIDLFVSSDEQRTRLMGIETTLREDSSLCFVATDGYRLAHLDTASESTAGIVATEIIPPAPLLAAAKHIPEGESANLRLAGRQAVLEFSLGEDCEAEMSVQVISPPFPLWEALIAPPKRPKRLHVSPRHLINAVDRTVLIHQSKDGQVILEPNEGTGTVTVKSVHPEAGEAKDVIACTSGRSSLPPASMFRARRLIEATKHCSDDEIRWEIAASIMSETDGGDPIEVPGKWVTKYLSPYSQSQLTIVLMPSRFT